MGVGSCPRCGLEWPTEYAGEMFVACPTDCTPKLESEMMTVFDTRIARSDPHHAGDVWHLTLQQEGRGSPSEADYSGGYYKMDGMQREQMIKLLRRLAERIERGEQVADIAFP